MSWSLIEPVIDLSVRGLCRRPYHGHKKGCPNYDKKLGCPPQAPIIYDVLDFGKPIWAVWIDFDLANQRLRMKTKHPNWSNRQLDCCLYWQGRAKKLLGILVLNFIRNKAELGEADELKALYVPEAMGVNVTETMKNAGVILEWPPENIVRKIAFLGSPFKSMQ